MSTKTLDQYLFELYTGKPFFGDIPVVYASFFSDNPKPKDGICDYIVHKSKPANIDPATGISMPFDIPSSNAYSNPLSQSPSQNIAKPNLGLHIEGTERGTYKFVNGPERSMLIMRLDLANHEHGDKHIQWLQDTFTGRLGNEAVEIFAEVYKHIGGKLKFPWED